MMAENSQSPVGRFGRSFSLRILLALIFVCAVAAAVWAQVIAPKLSAERQRRLHARLRERGFEVLGPKASNLRRDQTLTRDDVALLSEAPGLAGFQWHGCNDETLRQLSQLQPLQLLDLEGDYTAAGFFHLAELPDLRALRLHRRTQEDLSLGQLRHLEILALEGLFRDAVFDAGDENWTKLQRLHTLDLRHLRVTENGLRQLGHLPELKSLSFLYCSGLTDERLRRIGELDQLKELNFLNCQDLTDEGLRHLGGLENLESLSLVCDPGLVRTEYKYDERGRPVSSSRVTVGASQQDFSDAGFRHLGGLSKLKNLCVYSPRLTDEIFITARELPSLSLLYLGLCPPNGSLPEGEMAQWLNTMYPWEPEQEVNALNQQVAFECENASLEEFALALKKAPAPITVNFSELERAGRLPVKPITARYATRVPLRQVLDEILELRQLGWVVSSDGRGISITTKEAAEKEKDRLVALRELRKSLKGEVLRTDTWLRRSDAYSVVELFNEHTFDSFQSELWQRAGK